MAALNDLEVKIGNVLNAYITAPVTEKVWTVLGHEFGSGTGKIAVIVCALYGLKSAGAAFRVHLASFMRQMGYTSCKANPNLWYKAETRPDDNFKHYAYILCYVDDILAMHHDPMTILDKINGYMLLKLFSWRPWHLPWRKAVSDPPQKWRLGMGCKSLQIHGTGCQEL
jgi:hypothetical protein